MAKRKVTKLDVFETVGHYTQEEAEGTGRKAGQPEDMLRYDHAFERPEGFEGLVVFPTYRLRGHGLIKGKPTIDRWRSFIIRLRPCDISRVMEVEQDMERNPDKWVSYVRGPAHELIPETYAAFLAADVH